MTQASPPQDVAADLGNRAAALLLDLFLFSFVAGLASVGSLGRYAGAALFVAYFVAMPVSPLQGTPGKWICRIKLCDRIGRRLTWRAAALRAGAMLGWFVIPFLLVNVVSFGGLKGSTLAANWWLLVFLPWATTGFRPRRESLFDLMAGSRVVRYRADTAAIADADAARKPSIIKALGVVLLCLALGAVFSIVATTQHSMSLRGRVAYAVEQTLPLREKVEAFHDLERRWPAATDLGIAASTPYPDGGSYRLAEDGAIVITFSVLPELKGRSIVFRPMRAVGSDQIVWRCQADGGFEPGYLPSNCR